jgi:heat shock protein HtpX
MYALIGLLFALLYGLMVAAGAYLGYGGFFTYALLAAVLLFVQYLIGPHIIDWSMGIKYVSEDEEPELHRMVYDLSRAAGIKKPRVCVSSMPVPNAFAFGRSASDGRVCVTTGIRRILSKEELRAVLGHEIAHIKNRDVFTMTLISIVPMICWYLAWNIMYSGGDRRDGGNIYFIGLLAFVFYFATNLLVLYGSRIREYYADEGSVALGNAPHSLASALYKLVYGSAAAPRSAVKQMEGYKAFFLNDPSRAASELRELAELDSDMSGSVDSGELLSLRGKSISVGVGDHMMELLSTHPNMLKRIKHLSHLT